MVSRRQADAFLITCEHGGNRVPAPYRGLFDGRRALLESHRGYDPGALLMAKELAAAFAAPLVMSTVSRLLVDLNRSIGHRRVFSDATHGVPAGLRARIVERHYRPYREQVENFVSRFTARGRRVVHISSHSFTPELEGQVRRADVGLLYDSRRPGEVELSGRWKARLAEMAPRFRVRRNYPYIGKADGLTSYLRKRFVSGQYVGIEIEINQKIVLAGGRDWTDLRAALIESLRAASSGAPSRGSPRVSRHPVRVVS
jgi:predicted N-formylglutamate amidohydrolase